MTQAHLIEANALSTTIYDVIIVGGGVAGLAAANVFHSSRQSINWALLEAQPQLGGRVACVTLKNINNGNLTQIDTGASWIHGVIDNPIYELYQKQLSKTTQSDESQIQLPLDLTSFPVSEGLYENDCPFTIYRNDTHTLISAQEAQKGFFVFQNIMRAIEATIQDPQTVQQYCSYLESVSDVSMNDIFDRFFKEYNLNNAIEIQLENSAVFNSLIRFFKDYVGEYCAADLSQLSYRYWMADDDFEGEQLLMRNMYSAVITPLVSAVPSDRCFCNQWVKEIKFVKREDGTHILSLETQNGEVWLAHKVVMTLSLGVLKANHLTLFKPPLPLAKQNAISKLGFGTLNKVILEFDNAFWSNSFTSTYVGLLNCGTTQTRSNSNVNSNTDTLLISSHHLRLVDLNRIFGIPVLFFTFYGEHAHALEATSDEAIVKQLCWHLQNIIPVNINVPTLSAEWKMPNEPRCPDQLNTSCVNVKLIDWFCTRWGSNPYTYGSYTYMKTGATSDDMDCLSEPWLQQVYFAGEATCKAHFGTLHAAYISGIREGCRISEELVV